MSDVLIIRLQQPVWDPTWGELQVSPAYYDELRAALDAANVPNSRVIKASAGEVLACIGLSAAATAPLWRALTPALEAFLSRHDNKRIEITSGDKSIVMDGYSANQVKALLAETDALRDERREVGGSS
ncbi:hypothetical protein [Micromonospora sp. RP3T]|uniref:hypothetical protein n=1 Tax=Micromonospora sp. RP3T TaxID=2135446 RepID=UPI000D17921A|nr:hypothetical protein [Micromonospora sp. RP3T]PTA45385.1 hypothetical protein C8054_14960 [Micromonospora sp. RP3T]